MDSALRLEESGDFDYIFFDFPGTVNSLDLIRLLSAMDYIFYSSLW